MKSHNLRRLEALTPKRTALLHGSAFLEENGMWDMRRPISVFPAGLYTDEQLQKICADPKIEMTLFRRYIR